MGRYKECKSCNYWRSLYPAGGRTLCCCHYALEKGETRTLRKLKRAKAGIPEPKTCPEYEPRNGRVQINPFTGLLEVKL